MKQEDYDDDNETIACIKPEITHFPDPLIKKQTRQHGAVIIHIVLALYMFIGENSIIACYK